MSDRVVGDEDCDTRVVVDMLFESKALTGLIENWKTIARDLGLHPTKVSQLDTKRKEESIEEIWYLILDAWVGAKGEEAKLSVLLNILRKPKYTIADAADKLQAKFFGSAAAPSKASTQQAAAAPPAGSEQLQIFSQLQGQTFAPFAASPRQAPAAPIKASTKQVAAAPLAASTKPAAAAPLAASTKPAAAPLATSTKQAAAAPVPRLRNEEKIPKQMGNINEQMKFLTRVNTSLTSSLVPGGLFSSDDDLFGF